MRREGTERVLQGYETGPEKAPRTEDEGLILDHEGDTSYVTGRDSGHSYYFKKEDSE